MNMRWTPAIFTLLFSLVAYNSHALAPVESKAPAVDARGSPDAADMFRPVSAPKPLVVGEAPPGRSPAMVGASAGTPPGAAGGDGGGSVDFSEYLMLHRRATKAIPFK